jgi:hypothetical protein
MRSLWPALHRLIHRLEETDLEAGENITLKRMLDATERQAAALKAERDIWQRRAMELEKQIQRELSGHRSHD